MTNRKSQNREEIMTRSYKPNSMIQRILADPNSKMRLLVNPPPHIKNLFAWWHYRHKKPVPMIVSSSALLKIEMARRKIMGDLMIGAFFNPKIGIVVSDSFLNEEQPHQIRILLHELAHYLKHHRKNSLRVEMEAERITFGDLVEYLPNCDYDFKLLPNIPLGFYRSLKGLHVDEHKRGKKS